MTPTISMARRPAPVGSLSRPVNDQATSSSPSLENELCLLSPFDLADALIQAWSRNERRLGELDRLESDIASARRRLQGPGAGRALVEAHLARLLARREACLSASRADARQAAILSREWDSRHMTRRAVGG